MENKNIWSKIPLNLIKNNGCKNYYFVHNFKNWFYSINFNETDKTNYTHSLIQHHIISNANKIVLDKEQERLSTVLLMIFKLLKWVAEFVKLDKAIYINNQGVAINLFEKSDYSGVEVGSVISYFKNTYANYLIVFRSFNDYYHKDLFQMFMDNDYLPLMSGQVWIMPYSILSSSDNALIKNDLKRVEKLRNHPDRFILLYNKDFLSNDDYFLEAERLHEWLSSSKFADIHPKFSADWMKKTAEKNLINYCGVYDKEQNKLKCLIGLQVAGAVGSPSVFLYDDDNYWHKIANGLLLEKALERKIDLNLGLGGLWFKKSRGAIKANEYQFVYINNCRLIKKTMVKALFVLLNKVNSFLLGFKKESHSENIS